MGGGLADYGRDLISSDSLREIVFFPKNAKIVPKFLGLATSGHHNCAMITNAENSQPNGSLTGCLLESIQNLSPGLCAAYQKGIYQNFLQSLMVTVTMYVLLRHDAKVNKPMWA